MEIENFDFDNYFASKNYGTLFIYVGDFGRFIKKQMGNIGRKKRIENRVEIVIESWNQIDFKNKIASIENVLKRSDAIILTMCGDAENAEDKATMEKIATELNGKSNWFYGIILQSERTCDCKVCGLENYMIYHNDEKSQITANELSKILIAFEGLFINPNVMGLDWGDYYQLLKYKKGEVCIFEGDSYQELGDKVQKAMRKMIADNSEQCNFFISCYSKLGFDINPINEVCDGVQEIIKSASCGVNIFANTVKWINFKKKQVVLYALWNNALPCMKVLPLYSLYSNHIVSNLSLRKKRYICVDMETSGIDEHNDEIIKLSAVEIWYGRFNSLFETLVKPEKEISSLITEIAGIENSQLESAPNIVEVMKEFKNYCGDSILIGHNIKGFTLKFLNKSAIKCGLEPFSNEIIDTLEMAKKSVFDVENYKLATLCKRFGIEGDHYSGKKEEIILMVELFSKLHKESVKVGIFWAIEGWIFEKHQGVELNRETISPSVISTGRIDSDFGHDIVWRETYGVNGDVDFATYPRGRVLYDYINSKHIIFVDECITNGEIEEILKIFNVEDYSLEYDEHYRCDGCLEF